MDEEVDHDSLVVDDLDNDAFVVDMRATDDRINNGAADSLVINARSGGKKRRKTRKHKRTKQTKRSSRKSIKHKRKRTKRKRY
jgi:hypothetical protein